MRTKQKNRKNSGIQFTTIGSGPPKQKKSKTFNPTPIKSSVDAIGSVRLEKQTGLTDDHRQLYDGLTEEDIDKILKLPQ